MALFGFLKKKRSPPATDKKKIVSKKKTVDAVMEKASIKMVENLATDDPEKLRKILIAYVAAKNGLKIEPDVEPLDPIDQMLATQAKLKRAGLDSQSRDDNWLRELLPTLGQILGPVLAQNMNTRVIEPSNNHQQIEAAPERVALNPAPTENNMNWVSPYLIAQLSGKDSAQAYNWLIGLNRKEITDMFSAIRQTPDDQMHTFLSRLAKRNPDFEDFILWMFERPDWVKGLIAIIKQPTAGAKPVGDERTGL